MALLGLVLLFGCSPTAPPSPAPSTSASSTAPVALPVVDCGRSVRHDTLPEWVQEAGFRDGASDWYVEGYRGEVAGVLFGFPLSVPKRPDRDNKILWVPRHPTGPGRLGIDAQLDGDGPVVHRDVGFGGGQSIVDLPRPGCWRMTLRWGDAVTDTVDVPYVPRRQ